MEFITVLIPIFGIFAVGFIGQKAIGFDTKPLSTMALYLMTPFLVFRTFYQAKIDLTYSYIFLYTIILCFALIGAVYLISFLKGYSVRETCGVILASAFMNNGNYGTPLVLFVYGVTGMNYALILMVVQQLVMSTVGVYYAAKGSMEEGQGFRIALRTVSRIPVVYGAILGALFHWMNIPLNKPVMDAINLVGNAAVPTVMIILGMTLAKISIKEWKIEKISYSLIIKLILSPVIAYLLTLVLPVSPMLKHIMILMAAMPTAANTTMFALEFRTDPDFVSSATLLSTILSLVTLPIILFILH